MTLVVAAAMTLVTASGCLRLPDRVDRAMTDDWPSFAEPVQFVPEAGRCHNRVTTIGTLDDYLPFDCKHEHLLETVYVGTLTGQHDEDGDATAEPGSAVRLAARAECDQRVDEFLGGPWQSARIDLVVVTPSPDAWDGGARWFRCDLGETVGVIDDDNLMRRTTTFADALADPDNWLRLGCYDSAAVGQDDDSLVEPLECDVPHQAEFVGTYVEDKLGSDAIDSNSAEIHARCRKLVASYAKVPNDDDLQYRAGTIYLGPSMPAWSDGNRTVRCFVWRFEPLLTRSVRGGGPDALPIRYE
ncbi:septum formation family protein [Solwaraspora sp. WMMB335]|uniref:septum formation family protein n=1 Tax=Solwaraspora sp. WMMB335 TaxID=3404118 RepID=UPI003B95D5B9